LPPPSESTPCPRCRPHDLRDRAPIHGIPHHRRQRPLRPRRPASTRTRAGPAGAKGTKALEATEDADVQPSLVAVETTVYSSPLVRPVSVHEPEAPVTVQVWPPRG
jgi:hypothetical protein